MRVTLNRGDTLVDEESLYLFEGRHWYIEKKANRPYVVASLFKEGVKSKIYLHRKVMKARRGQHVDHINGDTLDNRRSNLRLCTPAQNCANQKKRPGRSKYKGVAPARNLQWRAKITVNYRDIWLGTFASEEDAARAYDAAAHEHFGEFARPNFPQVSA